MYNQDVFPGDLEAQKNVDYKVPLDSYTDGKEYLESLTEALQNIAHNFDLIFYNAGTDVLAGDRLGLLNLKKDEIIKRDEIVFKYAFEHNTPIVMVLSGGYQKSNAKIIADSILNLRQKFFIKLQSKSIR